MNTKLNCRDCGASPVNHRTEYWSVIMDWLFSPFYRPMDVLWRRFLGPLLNPAINGNLVPLILKTLARFRIASVKTKLDPAKDESTLQCLWAEAERRGIKVRQFILFNRYRGICLAEYGGLTHCFDRLPRPKNSLSESINWMDNKRILKKKLFQAGLPAPAGRAVFSFAKAKKVFEQLEKPLVVKPHLGSASRHTTMHVENLSDLYAAFKLAKKLSPFVIIEEELAGSVYRITFIGGKIAGVIRREEPRVVGNGRDSVRVLIDKENQQAKRQGPIFFKIDFSNQTQAELKRQNLDLESIPEKGQLVTLNPKINWSVGGTTTDVTDSVHPENVKLFCEISRLINDPLLGIDFIIGDIGQSWRKQSKCGVIECNAMPFIDNHHFPFYGESRNAAGALWDIIFPGSKGNTIE